MKRNSVRLGALVSFVALSAVAGLLVALAVTPGLAVAGATTKNAAAIFETLPDYLEIGKLPQRNVLFADKGGQQVPFATIYHQNRVSVSDAGVDQTAKDALVSGEDRRFFEHNGIDATSTARAVVGQITGHDAGGASTLTMQLVRNILVAEAEAIPDSSERQAAYKKATEENLGRKLAEMKYALGLEKHYSKDQILLAYLNIAYFGDQAYGIEAASQHFLGKSAEHLTPAEAASLIATVQYPTSRNLSTPANYQANKARRDVILDAMRAEGKLDQAAFDQAVATPVGDYVRLTPAVQGCLAVTEPGAGHWCDLITRSVVSLPALGRNDAERRANWKAGGYEIHTSLDLDLNAKAKSELEIYAPNTETRYDLGGVVTSLEPGTGRVRVLTQNKDFDNTKEGGGRTTTSVNYAVDQSLGESTGFQPGSTYKPFTLIDWLEKGHRLTDTVDATPRTFTPMTTCGSRSRTPDFHPKNDNGGNPGTVTALRATTQSINTGYAAMAQKLDLCDIRDAAKSLGVHSATGKELSTFPSSVIGSGNEIAPLTMAAAFSGIANGGVFCEPTFIDSVVDSEKRVLPGQVKSCTQAIDPAVAATTVSALKTVFASGTATAANPGDGVPVMGKTGTTDHAEQTWLVGSTTKLATAAWVGNISGHQDQYKIRGSHGAMNQQRLTIWKHVMQAANKTYGGGAFAAAPRASGGSTSGGSSSGGGSPTVEATPTSTPAPTPTSTPHRSPGHDDSARADE
ncbi:transglycosylase domain-containing protein [Frondihabitans cladoniiphilus]|uniref:Transglycosylase domain-containing protein n=1 Tax=Frondihabitans cladoniiphilus TaxID=715785 RepID=A0ABP8W4H7_9MICO